MRNRVKVRVCRKFQRQKEGKEERVFEEERTATKENPIIKSL
jgi:hypothetical protein